MKVLSVVAVAYAGLGRTTDATIDFHNDSFMHVFMHKTAQLDPFIHGRKRERESQRERE